MKGVVNEKLNYGGGGVDERNDAKICGCLMNRGEQKKNCQCKIRRLGLFHFRQSKHSFRTGNRDRADTNSSSAFKKGPNLFHLCSLSRLNFSISF